MASGSAFPKKRQLPKLMACITKQSLENFRSKALFSLAVLDANGIRRRKLPLDVCLIMEMKESGFFESSAYLNDLIYDNVQLVDQDDIGIVVDLRKRPDYLEHISDNLQKAEQQREKGDTKKECLFLLNLALYFAEKEKGILWLSEKFFQAAIAVSSQYLIDGGRLKGVCKYHYGKFLLTKFPGADPEEPFSLLTEVRDSAIGKTWPLYEPVDQEEVPPDTLFCATAIQLHGVLLNKARSVRKLDTPKSERLSRLAERRAKEANETDKTAEAIIEIGICQLMMNNLNNAQKTFERAFKIHERSNNVEGLCETRMHLAAVMQRLSDHETAARLLTEMGALAMKHGLRRQLGRALHLLGELHLRREKPELGTQHLAEAFLCFMGFRFEELRSEGIKGESEESIIPTKPSGNDKVIYEEEAEQSRLMTAISAGQELMASYFNLLREAGGCAVAKMKIIEWKLSHAGWWIKRQHHEFLPCPCAIHNRTALDVMWNQMKSQKSDMHADLWDFSSRGPLTASKGDLGMTSDRELGRTRTTPDIRKLHSSFIMSSRMSQHL